jgi:hypothetical protein
MLLKSQDEKMDKLEKLNQELEIKVGHMDADNKMLKSEFSEFRQAYAALEDRVEYLEAITAKIGMSKKELHGPISLSHRSMRSVRNYSRLYFDESDFYYVFVEVPRTCYDLKLLGVTKSGKYLIDPDGPGIGDAPFEVFCDMEAEGHCSICSR